MAGVRDCEAFSNQSQRCVKSYLDRSVYIGGGRAWLKRLRTGIMYPVILVRSYHLKMVEARSEDRLSMAQRMETDLRFTMLPKRASGRPLWSSRSSPHLVLRQCLAALTTLICFGF